MIVGIGLDLIEVERIGALFAEHGEKFARRILHEDEDASRLERGEGPVHLAGLFAAKEAVMKALGTGMSGARFTEIGILNRPSGQPYVVLSGKTQERANEMGIASWHVSITHSRTSAAAVAIALQ